MAAVARRSPLEGRETNTHMPRQTAPGPLATVSASILQLRQELLAASEQRPQAARRNAALVDQVQQTLTAAVAVQAERRREVEEEASQRRRVAETRCQEHARLHSQLGTHHAEFYEEALEMALLEEEIAGQQVELASGAPTRVYEHASAVVCPADATPTPSDHRDAPSSELQPPWALADEEVTDSLHFGWVNDAAPPRLLEEDALQRGAVPSSPPSLLVSRPIDSHIKAPLVNAGRVGMGARIQHGTRVSWHGNQRRIRALGQPGALGGREGPHGPS